MSRSDDFSLGARIAGEARQLVGVPFRLHGRSAETGLDCIGLVALALKKATDREVVVPQGYRLRNADISSFLELVCLAGLHPIEGRATPGDVLHTRPGPAQDHLAIAIGRGHLVHAHAGLRRVVLAPIANCGALLHHWRAQTD